MLLQVTVDLSCCSLLVWEPNSGCCQQRCQLGCDLSALVTQCIHLIVLCSRLYTRSGGSFATGLQWSMEGIHRSNAPGGAGAGHRTKLCTISAAGGQDFEQLLARYLPAVKREFDVCTGHCVQATRHYINESLDWGWAMLLSYQS